MHILLTGASCGVGRQLAVLLEQQGHQLSLCGRNLHHSQTGGSLLQDEQAHLMESFCLTDIEAVDGFAKRAKDCFGPIDILINCSGPMTHQDNQFMMDPRELEWLLAIPCQASIAMIQAVLPSMKQQHRGLIINLLSTNPQTTATGLGGYSVSKAAFDSFVHIKQEELDADGIKLISVYPEQSADLDGDEEHEFFEVEFIEMARALARLVDVTCKTHFADQNSQLVSNLT